MQPLVQMWSRLLVPAQGGWQVDLGLLLMRLWFGGAMLILHGFGKLSRFMADPHDFGDPLGMGAAPSLFLATFAELVCAALLVVGLATRLATIPLMITMLVAGLMVHSFNELALSYFIAYAVLLLLGPGRWSIDQRLRRQFLS